MRLSGKILAGCGQGGEDTDGTEELLIGEERVAFVEYENGTLVLRVKGQNRSYTAKTLPAKIALTLSQKVMKPDAAANKVFFGAFLVLDHKGDVELAGKAWKEAADGGVDVKRLLPELDAERPLPPVELPVLTPALKNVLSEKNWSFRVKGEKGCDAQAPRQTSGAEFGRAAGVADSGRRERELATDCQEAAFGGFRCPPDSDRCEEGASLGSAAGENRARSNRSAKPPKMAGVFGLSLPAGSQCMIAALEFASR